ncbi:hypothetical protein ACSBR2_017643 [Camellia fascicularis]
MGAVPVSATNFYKLLSSNAHYLEERKIVKWNLSTKKKKNCELDLEQQFIFIPFGSVGEDDIGQLLVDYDDLMKVPHIKAKIKEVAEAVMQLRTDDDGELGNQDPHLPLILPKLPGHFYNLFEKPIETEGRKQELRNRDKSPELNLEVKSEVERCMAYLKEEREHDPYRNILPRTIYQAMHGFDCEVPTFKL